MKDSNSDYNVPIYVTSMGQRYVKVEDLVRSERIQNTLKRWPIFRKNTNNS